MQTAEKIRDYHRNHVLQIRGKGILIGDKRPRPDDVCELCGAEVNRLDYHHWDDRHIGLGMWLCVNCHKMAHRIEYDASLPNRYLALKDDITSKFNRSLFQEHLGLRI